MITDLIKKNKNQFLSLCKTHKIKSLFAFGSSVTGNFNAESDVDLVVDIAETDPLNKGELLFSLWDKLEDFLREKWICSQIILLEIRFLEKALKKPSY